MRSRSKSKQEVKIAEEVWDILGGEGTFDCLKLISKEVGQEIRDEVGLFKDLIEK